MLTYTSLSKSLKDKWGINSLNPKTSLLYIILFIFWKSINESYYFLYISYFRGPHGSLCPLSDWDIIPVIVIAQGKCVFWHTTESIASLCLWLLNNWCCVIQLPVLVFSLSLGLFISTPFKIDVCYTSVAMPLDGALPSVAAVWEQYRAVVQAHVHWCFKRSLRVSDLILLLR